MNEIKEIVDNCQIYEKRERADHNRIIIPHIKRLMSDLCFYRGVYNYVNFGNRLQYEDLSLDERRYILEELEKLRKDRYVIEYIELEKHCNTLFNEITDYYRTIQEGLRHELLYLDVPNIYVLQKPISFDGVKQAKHIIDSDDTISYKGSFEETLVMPYDMKSSIRKNRHFYNQVSFRYLEAVCDDYSFDLDNKDIGKVKILK